MIRNVYLIIQMPRLEYKTKLIIANLYLGLGWLLLTNCLSGMCLECVVQSLFTVAG